MKRIVLTTIRVADVEDPEVYVAEPIYNWQQTAQGAWAMQHGHDLTYHRTIDYNSYANTYIITGDFTEEDCLYYTLRWGQPEEYKT